MNEKNYRINMQTPLGKRWGTLLLRVSEGYVEGELNMFQKITSVTGTISDKCQISLEGELKTLLDSIRYSATGSISGRILLLNLETDSGQIFPVIGEEIPVEE